MQLFLIDDEPKNKHATTTLSMREMKTDKRNKRLLIFFPVLLLKDGGPPVRTEEACWEEIHNMHCGFNESLSLSWSDRDPRLGSSPRPLKGACQGIEQCN